MLAALLGLTLAGQNAADTCMVFTAHNLARGNGNWFMYFTFSDEAVTIKLGDTLQYDVFIDPKSPVWKGGVDMAWTDDSPELRDLGVNDQNGIRAHGDGMLDPAAGKWYTRKIPLDKAVGKVTKAFNLQFEGDVDGRYAQFIDNVYVLHSDGTKTTIYENGLPRRRALWSTSGYSNKAGLFACDRAAVAEGKDLEPVIQQAEASAERLRSIADARSDIDVVKKFLQRNPNPELEGHVKEAEYLLERAEQSDAEDLQKALHAAKHALSHTHPVMQQYTGHLVGHAHIDLQWLWEWQEGIAATHDTFRQAAKFMDEFKGFTFSQSSSCLYAIVEETFPDLFKVVKSKIQKGQWEVVGGRVCEGDTNMISPESHARQFLYGQAYFRERFNKTAIVGWEPDTFGHTIQMPQILKLGGCEYYYFCRGGKGKPLFWWQGLDGTKMLSFEEPATGSWYNSDLSYKQFQELLDFEKSSGGSKDTLWVYGVGNHGGGPTREHIEEAVKWMKSGYLPNAKFSTATQFFKKLSSYDLTKIPTVDKELNPVFDGCYTSHVEVKRLNRDAEAWTTSAEAVATVASQFGFTYPQAGFRRNWEDICINHHHDTLPGSGIHPPYENTKVLLGRVLADDHDVINRAMQMLSLRVKPMPGGISVMVFNPTGVTRSDWIGTYLVQSGWDGSDRLNPNSCMAFDPKGNASQVDVLDQQSRYGRFYATDIPAYGWKVFQIKNVKEGERAGVEFDEQGRWAENGFIRVEFDNDKGYIKRIVDKASGREIAGELGKLEYNMEKPGGMSAWVIGQIDHRELWDASDCVVTAEGSGVAIRFNYTKASTNSAKGPTTASQVFHIHPWSKQVEVDVETDWRHVGSNRTNNPALRVAFSTNLTSPTATYEVPFGALSRPVRGSGPDTDYNGEYPGLKWADLTDGDQGLAVLNDGMHGFSAEGSTLRMSLIRSSYEPDPVPNPGIHHWRYAVSLHGKGTSASELSRAATAFNQPMVSATVPFDATGTEPLTWSLVDLKGKDVVTTGLKRAENGKGAVLRFYQAAGKSDNAEIRWNAGAASAELDNFLEDKLSALPVSGNTVKVALHGWQIATVRAVPGKSK